MDQSKFDRLYELSRGATAKPAVETIDGRPIEAPIFSKDADTLGDTMGRSFRIKGFNAPETAKIRGGIFVPGQVLNDTNTYDVNKIAAMGGFTDLQTEGKDVYGRTLAEQVNPETGAKLGDMLVKSGLMPIDRNTSTDVVREQGITKSAVKLFGTQDPILKHVNEVQRKRTEQGLNPIYKPRIYVPHSSDYAAFQKGIGSGAVAEEAKEVDRLKRILETEDMLPETRAKLEGQLTRARENIYMASTMPNMVAGAMHQPEDRNRMNEANDQFFTSLKAGALDIQKQFFGVGELVGDTAKWEWLSKYAREKNAIVGFKEGNLADTLSSYKDISTQGGWDTIADTATYVTNLAAGTLPMMATMIGSSIALGSGVGTIPIAALYAGGFYAEQPEDKKNPTMALALGIPAGILDRLGLEALLLKNSFFSVAGKKEIVDALVAKNGITEKAAEQMLTSMTKKELTDLAGNAAEFASKQINTAEAFARGMAILGTKAGVEAGTEVAQTAAELLASSGQWSTDVQYERHFAQSLMDAAIGGGALGGAIAGAGNVKNAAEWHGIADREKQFKGDLDNHRTFAARVAPKYVDVVNGDPNIIRNAAMQHLDVPKPANLTKTWYKSLDDFPQAKGAWNAMKSIVDSPGRLIRQLGRQMIPPEKLFDANGNPNENLGILQAIIGGYGNLPGDHYSAAKQRQMGRWSGNLAEELAADMGVNLDEANKAVREAYLNHWQHGRDIPTQDRQSVALNKWLKNFNGLRTTMMEDLRAAGVDFTEVMDNDALFSASTVDPATLAKHRNTIEEILQEKGASPHDAKITVDKLLSTNPEEVAAARNYAADLGLFKDPRSTPFFENNIFTTLENLKDTLSNRLVGSQYLGENGQVLTNLLNKAYQAGELNDQELAQVAKDVKDWYDIIHHNYHPLDDHPRLEKVLSWATTLTMMAFLGKAALSSQVEVATSMLGTPAPLIKRQIAAYWDNFKRELGSDINKANSATLAKLHISYARETSNQRLQEAVIEKEQELMNLPDDASVEQVDKIHNEVKRIYEKMAGRKLFERLGYNETGYNTQSKFEYADSNQRQAMHIFATVIGLRAQTDALRMAVMSVASDIAVSKLMNLAAVPQADRPKAFATGDGLNKGQVQDLNDLTSWGMDIHYVLDKIREDGSLEAQAMLHPDNVRNASRDTNQFEDHILSVLGNMVDSKVMNPQAHNLPKYYHDPRLRVLTAMQRFMATAGAVLLPKLYIDYLKNGNAGMRYQAFSVVASAILLAFFVNGIKDQLSYGEDSPYVNGVWANLQRSIYTSGMLGQLERVVDAVDPLYDRKIANPTNNPFKALWDTTTGISPVASWVDRPVRAVLAASEGDAEQAVRQAVRGAPLLGSFPIAAGVLSSQFKEE
jgi:hypothetical protein